MTDRLRDRVEAEASQLVRERAARIRRSLDEALALLSEPLEVPLTPGEWGAAGGSEHLRILRDVLESIAHGESQRDILSTVLDAAGSFYRRAALFVVKEGSLTGWAGLGFTGDGGFRNEHMPRLTLPATGDHLLAQALQRRSLAIAGEDGPGETIVSSLGGVRPGGAVAMPMMMRERPVAVLYGDSGRGDESGQPLGLEIVARLGGLALGGLGGAQGRRARAGSGAAHPGALAPSGSGYPHNTAPSGPHASEPRGAVLGGPTPPEDAEIQALLADIDGHPRREGGDSGMSDEDRRSHSDARRFASLLVSELLLYNEESVIHGRKNRDLWKRLEKEIERSRQAYEARVPGRIRTGTRYLEDEMVRVLAEGDRALLGR